MDKLVEAAKRVVVVWTMNKDDEMPKAIIDLNNALKEVDPEYRKGLDEGNFISCG
jgi:hypothetical protein